jgi:hypothetical protein
MTAITYLLMRYSERQLEQKNFTRSTPPGREDSLSQIRAIYQLEGKPGYLITKLFDENDSLSREVRH